MWLIRDKMETIRITLQVEEDAQMTDPVAMHATLDDWIAREGIPASDESPATFNRVVAEIVASLGDSLELLGFGEALHGGEDILMLRNRLFQRLVEAHGYTAIAIESSFPRGRVGNEFVSGRGPSSYKAIQDTGLSHGFGRLEANRELMEWMRRYNADPSNGVELHFYGFDLPALAAGPASPSQGLHFVLDYLSSVDSASGQKHRERIDPLLGEDSQWEDYASWGDPNNSIGQSPTAIALRIEIEDFITALRVRRPELVAKSDEDRYLEAMQNALIAREHLNFHSVLALEPGELPDRALSIRDAQMADNLAYVVAREHDKGKVFAFAHNTHLKRGKAEMSLGADVCTWWSAGSVLNEMFGPRYAVIGSAVGVSEANGIGLPEAGTLEARLTAMPGPALFIPTHKGQGLPTSEIAVLPTRLGSIKNSSYIPLTPQNFTDYDWLAVLDSTAFNRVLADP
jgi:erythromycin esterase